MYSFVFFLLHAVLDGVIHVHVYVGVDFGLVGASIAIIVTTLRFRSTDNHLIELFLSLVLVNHNTKSYHQHHSGYIECYVDIIDCIALLIDFRHFAAGVVLEDAVVFG